MSDSGSVFGPGPRHDASPASHRESSAQFLERVAGDYWQAVRDLLDDWLGRVPPPERRDLMGRLRRAEDHTFRAAFLELYLHESLVQSGFDVEFHPEVPGVRRRPDFLALSTSSTFYLEARSPSTATNKRASAGRVGDVHDALNRVDSPNFWLWIDVEAEGGRPLATKGLRAQLEGWLAGLDPDSETSHEELPSYHWEREGWQIRFRALPKSPAARGSGTGLRPLAVYGGSHAEWVDDAGVLKDALSDKGNAYGLPEHGLVVAIGTSFFSRDDFGVKNALYGPEQWVLDREGREFVEVTRGPGGYFHAGNGQWAHQHVSGVLIVNNLHHCGIPQQRPSFWANPQASREVVALDAWDVVALRDGHLERTHAAVGHRELFQLPEPWPPGEAFPK